MDGIPTCPTCSKPMVPNPARPSAWGMGFTVWGSPGDPVFVCTVDDAAHDAARAARATEAKRLLKEAADRRAARETETALAARVGELESAAMKEGK